MGYDISSTMTKQPVMPLCLYGGREILTTLRVTLQIENADEWLKNKGACVILATCRMVVADT